MNFLRRIWKWSWLVTLPVALALFWWLTEVGPAYTAFHLRHPSGAGQLDLNRGGRHALHRMLRGLASPFRGDVEDQGIRVVHLRTQERDQQRLDERLPHSGFEYVDGQMWKNGGFEDIQLRYRGDFALHWAFEKKSYRIKTRKDELFEGMRRFNLIVPKYPLQLNNYLGYRLAQRLGLVTPVAELAMVTLNGRTQGFYLLVEQIEEMTLRRHGLMPGDIYAGELLAKDAWQGVTPYVFDHPGLWEKVAVNNHFDPTSREPLQQLCRVINGCSSEETQARLSELLDMEAWGRFGAFEVLAQSIHTDPTHNWRLYFDPWRQRFLPVVWDPNTWGGYWIATDTPTIGLDPASTRLHALLLENGDFLRARHEALREFLLTDERTEFVNEVHGAIETLRSCLDLDANIRPEPRVVRGSLRIFPDYLAAAFARVEEAYFTERDPVQFAAAGNTLVLRVRDRRPVHDITVRFAENLPTTLGAALRYSRSGSPVTVDASSALTVAGRQAQLTLDLSAQLCTAPSVENMICVDFSRAVVPGDYVIEWSGANGLAIDQVLVNGAEPAERVREIAPVDLDHVYRVGLEPPPTDTRWSGRIAIEGVQRIDGALHLAAGTEIVLAPGAALILGGPLLAEGTADAPILFRGEGWATVALEGRAADGSRIRHCVFEDGSGLKSDRGLFEYSAMFSVHDVRDVLVADTTFRRSRVVDDMVHVVYAEIEFRGCHFERSAFDALDLDCCRAVVDRCTFTDSGNDALDLMSSEVVVSRTRIERSGDKGISVGEGTRLLAVHLDIADCAFGLQVKDRSIAVVQNATLRDNTTAVEAYKKNWRYDTGGELRMSKSALRDNGQLAVADEHSSIDISDSYVDRTITALRNVAIGPHVDAEPRRAATPSPTALPASLRSLSAWLAPYWDLVDPARRGTEPLR